MADASSAKGHAVATKGESSHVPFRGAELTRLDAIFWVTLRASMPAAILTFITYSRTRAQLAGLC